MRTPIERVISHLTHSGPAAAPELCRVLGVSQPTFSRLVRKHPRVLLIGGKARQTRYAARRKIHGVNTPIPLYEITTASTFLGNLHPVYPRGFYIDGTINRWFDDLPWFLQSLRPQGYLGRLIPRRHPGFSHIKDIKEWSGDEVLRYQTRLGWNAPGAFVVGRDAYAKYEARSVNPQFHTPEDYPRLAGDVLRLGDHGSSAGGEQPKFLAIRPDHTAVLVKFSPPTTERIGRRRADLLVCEHLALEILSAHGVAAAKSRIVMEGDRVFLELVRFDRTGLRQRRGVIALESLDAEFTGEGGDWTTTCRALVTERILPGPALQSARWLDLFGTLIANTDRHSGNLSFFLDGLAPGGLTPIYDMLPMLYAPHAEQIVETPFAPVRPPPDDHDIWPAAHAAALRLWQSAAKDPRISDDFQDICHRNAVQIAALI